MITARYIGHQNSWGDPLAAAIKECVSLRRDTAYRIKIARTKASQNAFKRRNHSKLLGYQAGLQQAKDEIVERLLAADLAYKSAVKKAESDCLTIAMTVAEELVASTLEKEKQFLAAMITRALKRLVEESTVQLLVNTADLEEIRSLPNPWSNTHNVSIAANKEISQGCARLATKAGSIDLDWRIHLKQLRERVAAQTAEPR